MFRNLTLTTAILATLGMAAASANAASVRIDTSRYDLSTARGVKMLNRRIAGAVEQVCGSYANASPTEADEIHACRVQVLADVSPRILAMTQTAETRNS